MLIMTRLIPVNRKNQLTPINSAFGEWQNMVDSFFSHPFLSSERSLMSDTFKLDIEETETEYLIEAEMPGIAKDEIDISMDGDHLTIAVNREEEADNRQKNYIHKERRVSSVRRSIRLTDVKMEDIKAKVDNGILHITIPKNEQVINQRKIAIE
jgi:HSP20 family protein